MLSLLTWFYGGNFFNLMGPIFSPTYLHSMILDPFFYQLGCSSVPVFTLLEGGKSICEADSSFAFPYFRLRVLMYQLKILTELF